MGSWSKWIVHFLAVSRRSIPITFFFFNDTATTEIYTLSLHDALPISGMQLVLAMGYSITVSAAELLMRTLYQRLFAGADGNGIDRKSTRLNSSHANISYAVFCLKKKKETPLRSFLPPTQILSGPPFRR